VIFVGDAVCTTPPLAGRGVTLALSQARALLAALDGHRGDVDSAGTQFDRWCAAEIRPWFDHHVVAAAAVDDSVRAAVEPYARMDALPASLDAVEPTARQIYADGWRPAVFDGPTRAELGKLCAEAVVDVA
jgi:flavin-dependent dehydrogenase